MSTPLRTAETASQRFRRQQLASNPEAFRAKGAEAMRRWRRNNPEKNLLKVARVRARKAGIPFDLAVSDIRITELCPVLGIRLLSVDDRSGIDNAPTLDKIEPSLGYVRGNVCVISHRANRLKSDASLDELKAVVAYVEAHRASE